MELSISSDSWLFRKTRIDTQSLDESFSFCKVLHFQ